MMRLVAENLSLRRGERLLFERLAFVLEARRVLLVTGPNGSGKSSLLRLVAGYLKADSGALRLELDAPTGEEAPALTEHAHYFGHRDGLRAALSAAENLAFFSQFLGGGGSTIDDALRQVGLGQVRDLPVGVLSAGQRRRVALARLLVCRRPLWLLDEPTSALDQASQGIVSRMVADHAASGGAALIATHLPLDVAADTLALGGASS